MGYPKASYEGGNTTGPGKSPYKNKAAALGTPIDLTKSTPAWNGQNISSWGIPFLNNPSEQDLSNALGPEKLAQIRATEQFNAGMKSREQQMSELGRLSEQLTGAKPFAQQIAMQQQTQQALANAQSQAAARRGINRGLASKMNADNLARISGQGREAYTQAGLEAYQQGLGQFQDLASKMAAQDAQAFSGLNRSSLNDQQLKYVDEMAQRQRALREALAASSNYWDKQAAYAGKPEQPGLGELALKTAGSLAPFAIAAML